MKRRYVLGAIALTAAAVGVTSVAFGGPGSQGPVKPVAVSAKQKSKRGPAGPRGPQGPQGVQGPEGQPADTSNLYTKAESDGRFVQSAPSGAFDTGVFTNQLVISPADGTFKRVLTLPDGFLVDCASNDGATNNVRVSGPASWAGNVTYNSGATFVTAPVSNTAGGTAAFGSTTGGTARFQVMNTAGATSPTKVWTIEVTILRNSGPAGISGGPHCIAQAIGGPA